MIRFYALSLLFCRLVLGQSGMPQFDLDRYQFAFLKRGPASTPEPTPEARKIQEGHMAHIQKMARLGPLKAAGPMAGDGDLRGIFVFKAGSLDEAKELASQDPAVAAGRLVIDWVTWMAPKGLGEQLAEQARLHPDQAPKYTMAVHYLALLKKGRNWTPKPDPAAQLAHLWSIRRRLDSGEYASAGPVAGGGSLVGLMVIPAATPEAARALAESDPQVAAGVLEVEIQRWYVAKEVWAK